MKTKRNKFYHRTALILYAVILVTLAAYGSTILRGDRTVKLEGFTVTAYCPHACCNGRWANMTVTGESISKYLESDTGLAAVDPEVIPLGTRFIYRGRTYIAGDTGSLIKGRKIDILLENHEDTVEFGIKHGQTIRVLP